MTKHLCLGVLVGGILGCDGGSIADANQKGDLLAEFDVWSGMAFSDPLKREAWSAGRKIVDTDTLSLAAAPTPGGHHVRLYLETDGKITTIISVKDDFETFHEGEPLNFVSLNGENLSGISPRSPNVSVSEDGVYAMTWDNFGSGRGEAGKVASPNFGLAFSVDGITWTVYSNALTVVGVTGFIRPGTGGDCPWRATGDLRQVIPVFVRGDQIRLYFNYPYMFAGSTTWCRNPTYNFGPDCVSGTAISN